MGGGVGTDLPEIYIDRIEIQNGLKLLDLLSSNGITSSKSEARRSITNKGIRINNLIVTEVDKELKLDDFKNKLIKISFGKKKHYLIKLN